MFADSVGRSFNNTSSINTEYTHSVSISESTAATTPLVNPTYRESSVPRKGLSRYNPWSLGRKLDHWQRSNKYSGWRLGVLSGSVMASFVLMCNVVLLLVGMLAKGGYSAGIATLHTGSATRIGRLSTMYHVLINVLSTLLLSASNYTMQVLCSPTRNDVDKAHALGRHVNIGILSAQNLRCINWRRVALWWTLTLSSIPLHLFYNAAIFKVTTGNQYNAYFINGANSSATTSLNSTMHNFTNHDWGKVYDAQYVSETSDIYLVVDQVSYSVEYLSSDPVEHNITEMPHPVFIDPPTTLFQLVNFSDGHWYVPDWYTVKDKNDNLRTVPNLTRTYHIQYAFAKPVDQTITSKVQIGLVFMIIVIVCNAVKALAMFLTFLDHRPQYLVTSGDALASFLSRPDPTTLGCCLSPYDKIEQRIKVLGNLDSRTPHEFSDRGQQWIERSRSLDNAISRLRGNASFAL
ncbi:hypothetical protein K432DRAFT_472278 [Lepidopterella palustris CBS 459.81]|uniref:DUF6536 domain-containing protein n=1 Tax=Lepidopterella palustris CBS 459.81 TaxID=1314670 RepID=A0A8E2DY13_9PEZI|nr:hypothetical protein K432DRAFT_472278 [Lepidopterella palustris CBS 459.81]